MSKAIAVPSSLGPLFDIPKAPEQITWGPKSIKASVPPDFRALALPGNGPAILAIDWAQGPPRLHDWLEWLRSRLATKPRILFGWSGDPLVGELGHREAFLRMVRATLRWGMQVCVRTESQLDDAEAALLKPFRSQLKFLVPLLGFAPTPSEIAKVPNRLDSIRNLATYGFTPKVALEPMIPGIHDRPETITKILNDMAIFSPASMQVGFLTLPEDRRGNLLAGPLEAARRGGYAEAYTEGPSLEILGTRMRLLPLAARQKAYARVHALAAVRGIRIDVCPWTNPDFVKKTPSMQDKQAMQNPMQPRPNLLKRFLELSHPG